MGDSGKGWNRQPAMEDSETLEQGQHAVGDSEHPYPTENGTCSYHSSEWRTGELTDHARYFLQPITTFLIRLCVVHAFVYVVLDPKYHLGGWRGAVMSYPWRNRCGKV